MPTVRLTLPFPLSVNNLYAGKRRRYATPAYKRWKREADITIMVARPHRFTVPVRVAVTLHPKDNRRRDADNAQKCLLDSLVRMEVIQDDSQGFVRGITTEWGSVANPPVAEVCITPA
jgi:Holliday junction resolvase RusA-like endonuclease